MENPKSKIKNPNIVFLFILIYLLLLSSAQALTLNESVQIALENSPQLIASQQNLSVAEAKLAQARAAVLPQVSLSASYGKNYITPVVMTIPGLGSFSTSPDEASSITSYSLSLQQPLYVGGRLMRAAAIVDANYQMAREDLQKSQNELIFNVISSYYGVIQAQKMAVLIKQRIADTKKHLEQTRVFYDSGLTTRSDVLMAETMVANLRQIEITASNGVRLAKLAFNNTLGRGMDQEISLEKENSFSTIDASAIKKDALLETAYKYRPEWRSFQLVRSIAGENVGIAVGGLLPSVLLIGGVGKSITEYPSYSSYRSDLNNWRAMLTASWTLFDGFSSVNKINEARANEAMIKTQEISVRNGIELEVNSAVFDLQAAAEKVAAAGIADDLARRSLKYAEVNYTAHIGTSLAVLDAEASLHQSQLDLLNAKFDLEIAKAKINKVVGAEVFPL